VQTLAWHVAAVANSMKPINPHPLPVAASPPPHTHTTTAHTHTTSLPRPALPPPTGSSTGPAAGVSPLEGSRLAYFGAKHVAAAAI
jgi:hypothetical protein